MKFKLYNNSLTKITINEATFDKTKTISKFCVKCFAIKKRFRK